MYTHISLFRFRDRNQMEAHRAEIKARLEAFPAHIPSICTCLVTENCLPQPPVLPAPTLLFCDLVQVLTFETEEALKAYPHDPYHMQLVKETDHLLERVCIVDYQDRA